MANKSENELSNYFMTIDNDMAEKINTFVGTER